MDMEEYGQQQTRESDGEALARAEEQQQHSAVLLAASLSRENAGRPTQNAVYMSEATLRLHRRNVWQGQPRHEVPPMTPNSEFQFEHTFQPLPQTIPDLLQNLEIPIVKNKGVKRCIEELGQYFRCTDYEFNFLHFWFLDVITDCFLRTQNRFHLPPKEQKIVLGWVLFFIDIIRDNSKNFSRNEFIKLFQETILGAAKISQDGNEILFPLKLVEILGSEVPYTESTKITSKTSDSVFGKFADVMICEEENLENEMNEEIPVYEELNYRLSNCDSCTCTPLDLSYNSMEEQLVFEDWAKYEVEMLEEDFLHHNFYLPETKVHPRFLSLSSIQELNNEVDIEDIFLKDIEDTSKLMFLEIGKLHYIPGSNQYYIIFRREFQEKSDEEVISDKDQKIPDDKQKDETMDASKTEDELGDINTQQGSKIKDLRKYQLLEQRIKNISDTDALSDWQMEDLWKTIKDNNGAGEEEGVFLGEESFDESTEYDEKEYTSFKVLWAIIDFISDYFSDNFQYLLVKMAMTSSPNLIIQKLNDEWPVPKQLKEDLTLYVKDLKDKYKKIPVKIKKEKMTEKKQKKVKGSKDESKSKDKKKQIKSDKASAKDKESKVKEKKKPPTEEELLLKKHLEELEAERQREEMNKKFLFPLQDAVEDEFFMDKFPNWKKVNWRKGKVKRKSVLEDDT